MGTGSTVHDGPSDRLGKFGLGTVKPVPVPAYSRYATILRDRAVPEQSPVLRRVVSEELRAS